jgi:Spy/CpxP family protein refolding chaperone
MGMMGEGSMMMGEGSMMMGGEMAGRGSGIYAPSLCIANAEELDISDEQLSKLESIHYDLKKKLIVLNAEKDIKRLELNELLDKEEQDLPAIEEKLKEVYNIKIKLRMEKLKTFQEVKEILSKKQVKKLKELIRAKKSKIKSKKGKGRMMMGD